MSSVEAVQSTTTKPAQNNSNTLLLQRKCACGGSAGLTGECTDCQSKKLLGKPLQTKLRINEPGDIYEQEADRIADQVMAKPANFTANGASPRIQRFSGQPNGQMDAVPAGVDQAIASPGRPLEPALRQDMEQRFGYDFSRVRVHTDAQAAESAKAAQARAYTVGRNVVFAAGEFDQRTLTGRKLLAHELTHVWQQSTGQTTREVAQLQPEETRTPKQSSTATLPTPIPATSPREACFDGKVVAVNKNNESAACAAITSADAPTPEGSFCVRRQGEAQRAEYPFRASHSRWYLLEPQFNTTRSRMDLHPGSVSKGCVTVTDLGCFSEIEAVLNSGGTTTGYGYDGYPPGNAESVQNPKKSVDCVAVLKVGYKQGACGNLSAWVRATRFQKCLKEEAVPVPAGAEAATAAENDLKMKCYQKTGYMFWAEQTPTMICTETGCSTTPAEWGI
jgi:hypothetical protein